MDTSNLDQDFVERLREGVARYETLDTISLAGLSPREVRVLQHVGRLDGGIGGYNVTGLSDEAFIASLMDWQIDDATPQELAAARVMLEERRRPPLSERP